MDGAESAFFEHRLRHAPRKPHHLRDLVRPDVVGGIAAYEFHGLGDASVGMGAATHRFAADHIDNAVFDGCRDEAFLVYGAVEKLRAKIAAVFEIYANRRKRRLRALAYHRIVVDGDHRKLPRDVDVFKRREFQRLRADGIVHGEKPARLRQRLQPAPEFFTPPEFAAAGMRKHIDSAAMQLHGALECIAPEAAPVHILPPADECIVRQTHREKFARRFLAYLDGIRIDKKRGSLLPSGIFVEIYDRQFPQSLP